MATQVTAEQTFTPVIQWDFGTAYELFISLHVLHEPEYFGIRPSYAAGVRSRIPAAERKLLEEVYPLTGVPLKWLYKLPAPKDGISALWALKQIPPAQRMMQLVSIDDPYPYHGNPEEQAKQKKFIEVLTRIPREGRWTPEDTECFRKQFAPKKDLKKDAVDRALDWWSRPEELGEGFFSALQSYYQAFFEEEEKRVEPILRAGLARAQKLASTMPFDKLFVELSQGLQIGDEFSATKFVIVPAFWTTPLVFFEHFDKDTMFLAFGARPADLSVIPGETLPEGLVRSLKALADPTRLKILFYLSKESLTPSELARRLQLRAPTITHHLSELRLASLVELTITHDEKRYAIRKQALEATFANLSAFLDGGTKE